MPTLGGERSLWIGFLCPAPQTVAEKRAGVDSSADPKILAA